MAEPEDYGGKNDVLRAVALVTDWFVVIDHQQICSEGFEGSDHHIRIPSFMGPEHNR